MRRELRAKYPGILRLPGRFRTGPLDGLKVTVRSAEWMPLSPPPNTPVRHGFTRRPLPAAHQRSGGAPWLAGAGVVEVPEVEITGAGDDFGWLLDAIGHGHLPPSTLHGLEELPYLRCPSGSAWGL